MTIKPVESSKFFPPQTSSFAWISEELILHIFSFLPFQQLGKAALVCKAWRILSRDNHLWRPFALQFLNSSVKKEDSYNACMHYLSISANLKHAVQESTFGLSHLGYIWTDKTTEYKIVSFHLVSQSVYLLYESANRRESKPKRYLIGLDLESGEKKVQFDLTCNHSKIAQLIESEQTLKGIFANRQIIVWDKKSGEYLESQTEEEQKKFNSHLSEEAIFHCFSPYINILKSDSLTVLNESSLDVVYRVPVKMDHLQEVLSAKFFEHYYFISTKKNIRMINLKEKTISDLPAELLRFEICRGEESNYFLGINGQCDSVKVYPLDSKIGLLDCIAIIKAESIKNFNLLCDYVVIFTHSKIVITHLKTRIKKEFPLSTFIPSDYVDGCTSKGGYPISKIFNRFNYLFVVHTQDYVSSQMTVFNIKDGQLIKINVFSGFHYVPNHLIAQLYQERIIGFKASNWSSWPVELKVINLAKKQKSYFETLIKFLPLISIVFK